ncbi:MAG: hypothetical protein Q9223_000273 [Gallowayella weberi]
MLTPISLVSFSILLAFSFPPALVSGYDCKQLNTLDHRCPDHNGPRTDYPNCLVEKFSVSAFIACADTKGPDAPQFSRTQDGDEETVGVIEVLTDALDTPGCTQCPLAGNIQKAAQQHGLGSFAKELCGLRPVDAGICCLRECLGEVGQEHSIEAFCNGRVTDLMTAPLVPTNCVSNKEKDDTTSDGGDTSDSDAGSGNGSSNGSNSREDSSTTTSSSGKDTSTSAAVVKTPSKTSSTIPTTSAMGNNAPATSTTSAPSTPQETPSVGAGSGRRATYLNRIQRLGFANISTQAVEWNIPKPDGFLSSRLRTVEDFGDPADEPVVDPQYYTTSVDKELLRSGVRRIEELMQTPAVKNVVEGKTPSKGLLVLCSDASDNDMDAEPLPV